MFEALRGHAWRQTFFAGHSTNKITSCKILNQITLMSYQSNVMVDCYQYPQTHVYTQSTNLKFAKSSSPPCPPPPIFCIAEYFFSLFLVLSCLKIATIPSMFGVIFTGIISGALLQLREHFHLSCYQQEMVVTSLIIGGLIASIIGG